MCQRIVCNSCGKPSYAGCGRHIEQVLGDVPVQARCHCKEGAAQHTPVPPKRASWLSSLLERSARRRP
jgi:hypothetical protein